MPKQSKLENSLLKSVKKLSTPKHQATSLVLNNRIPQGWMKANYCTLTKQNNAIPNPDILLQAISVSFDTSCAKSNLKDA